MTKGQTEVPVVYVLLLRSMIYHDEEPVVPQWIREDTDA